MNRLIKNTILLSLLISPILVSQSQLLPLDHQLENKFSRNLYSIENPKHTSIHPFELKDITNRNDLDSLLAGEKISINADESWLKKKLYSEHLLDVVTNDYRIYGDIQADFQLGRDFHDGMTTFVNTRGFTLSGTVSDNFSFYTETFENQAIFPNYLDAFIRKDSIVPGQGYQRSFLTKAFDYSYSSAVISYRPSQYLSFQGGHGKNFIGDGYRSLLLSDVAFNYPYFKITADIWKLKYMMLWAEFQNLTAVTNVYGKMRQWSKKAGVFHYLDMNITDRLSIGVFEGIIWLPQDSTYNRGIEWNYLNPIIFFRPVEFSQRSPDNILLGINTRYILTQNVVIYGQFMIDEFTDFEFFGGKGYWGNKYGIQLGLKSFNAFQIPSLFLQFEFNSVTPYTFSHKVSQKNYSHYRQSIAHLLGANFNEYLGIANYTFNRLDFRLQLNFSTFGTDSSQKVNYGQNIGKSYDTRTKEYGNFIGQGVKNTLYYYELRVSYLLNPLTNLRIEASYVYRDLTSGATNSTTSWFSFGIRTSFRNLYYDF